MSFQLFSVHGLSQSFVKLLPDVSFVLEDENPELHEFLNYLIARYTSGYLDPNIKITKYQ